MECPVCGGIGGLFDGGLVVDEMEQFMCLACGMIFDEVDVEMMRVETGRRPKKVSTSLGDLLKDKVGSGKEGDR